jgi:hypothetical protein
MKENFGFVLGRAKKVLGPNRVKILKYLSMQTSV